MQLYTSACNSHSTTHTIQSPYTRQHPGVMQPSDATGDEGGWHRVNRACAGAPAAATWRQQHAAPALQRSPRGLQAQGHTPQDCNVAENPSGCGALHDMMQATNYVQPHCSAVPPTTDVQYTQSGVQTAIMPYVPYSGFMAKLELPQTQALAASPRVQGPAGQHPQHASMHKQPHSDTCVSARPSRLADNTWNATPTLKRKDPVMLV